MIVKSLILILLAGVAVAGPKVTQAALSNFPSNQVFVLAVEELGKPLLLQFVGQDKKVVYSTAFGVANDPTTEYSYENPFLRFRNYKLKGFPSSVVFAVCAAPGGSDECFLVKLVSEIHGRIMELTEEAIDVSSQGGVYLGYINPKYGSGMVVWKDYWGQEAHYGPHRYEIQIFNWDDKNARFILKKGWTTKRKFKDGKTALQAYGLPSRNFVEEVVVPGDDVSTVGIEGTLLPSAMPQRH